MKQKHPKGSLLVAGKKRLAAVPVLPAVKTAARHAAAALAAAILCRVEFVSGVCPFGLAFIIGSAERYTPAALVGFVLGSLSGGVSAARTVYLAAVGVVAALRWILSGIGRTSWTRNSFLPCLIAGSITVLFTDSAILVLSGQITLPAVLRTVAGVCVVCAFSYFYSVSLEALRRRAAGFSGTQMACLALSLCTLLMGLCPIAAGPLSLGRIAGAAAALCAVYLLSSPFDVAVLAAVSAAYLLSDPGFAFAAAGLCAAGGLACLFKKRGRAFLCLVFVVGGALLAACAQNYVYMITYLSELMSGAFLFLLLPLRSGAEARFDRVADGLASATAAVSVKLDSIAASMRDVTALLDNTVEVKNARCNMDRLYSHVADRVCKSCPRMSGCWVEHYGETAEAFNKLTPVLTASGAVQKSDFGAPFAARCARLDTLLREVNRCYKGYLDYIARIKNTQLYKGILRRQFSAVAAMLDSAKTELCAISEWDEGRSKRIYDCAARLNLPVETASFVYGYAHRPSVTLTLSSLPGDEPMRRLAAGISMIAGVPLCAPVVETKAGSVALSFTERPAFSLRTACAQAAADSDACGDVYSVFTDLHGSVHMLLSDGMGTGKAAARDGTICCAFLRRLLESGFPIRQAAELANTALALREDNESASTLDVLSFDVFSGRARLFKAGAAPTYILRGSRVETVAGRTLPVGILEYVLCRETAVDLHDGDLLVMVSDGVEQTAAPFIEQTLKRMFDAPPEEICRELIRRAKAEPGAGDDVTALVARVEQS